MIFQKSVKFLNLNVLLWVLILFFSLNQQVNCQNSSINQSADNLETSEITNWLKQNAVVLKSVEAENGFKDLAPLKKILKDVKVVGLGESTHGTREFFQFKHRMLEFLVKEMNYRLFMLESSYAACQPINDYVMGANLNDKKVLAGQGYWTWNTEEVLAMINWMRDYNSKVSVEKKIKFLCYDQQYNNSGEKIVISYLEKVAPEKVENIKELFKVSMVNLYNKRFQGKEEDKKEALAMNERYLALIGMFTLNEKKFISRSSTAEFNKVYMHVRMMAQYADTIGSEESPGRDFYMAETIERLLREESPDAKAVVWAHNAHVEATEPKEFQEQDMGWQLRKTFGDKYYAVGFSFNNGSFRSYNYDSKQGYQDFQVNPVLVNSVDWYLAQLGFKNYFIDFRYSKKDSVVGKWLNTQYKMRSIGSIYQPSEADEYYSEVILKNAYDGLVFFNDTTYARPIKP